MCKGFGSTLSGAALQWFVGLPNKSISSFADLLNAFNQIFAARESRRSGIRRPTYRVQGFEETTRDYLNRFNKEKVSIPRCDIATAIQAFRRGLHQDSQLYKELTMHPCTTFEEVQSKAIAVMRLEEDSAPVRGTYDSDQVSRKAPVEKKSERSKPYSRSVNKVSGNAEGKSGDRLQKVSEYGFTTNLAGLFKALKELGRRVRWPKLPEGNPSSRDTAKVNTTRVNSADQVLPSPPPHCSRTVNVITGGSELCGLTYSAAKRHATRAKGDRPENSCRVNHQNLPSVTFDETDAGSTPEQHHDALIITLPIGNCKVKKILVDTGSSVNLIMMETLKGMGFTEKDLAKKAIPLVGFSGETKHSLGEIIIPTYAGGVNRQALDPRDESNSLNVPPMPESQRIQDEYIEPQQAELDEVILDSLHPERTVLIGSECRAMDPRMMAYLDVAKELKVKFVTFNIKQIPREQNAEADALATRGQPSRQEPFPRYQLSTSLEPRTLKSQQKREKVCKDR
ncbi:uncharacterized protein LOC141628969 [Silene latifolia]|uniref:uncharacterized protein LOC141628969 n=1 Tax=Silene latifolia TaxID=37657 RepID=UPI003D77BEFB